MSADIAKQLVHAVRASEQRLERVCYLRTWWWMMMAARVTPPR